MLPRLIAGLNDSHVFIDSPFPNLNLYDTPILIWPVENKFIIAAVEAWDDSVEIAPGDEIIAIDGEPVEEVKRRKDLRGSDSTYQSEQRRWRSSLYGPKGVPVQLTLSRDGRIWTVSAPRDRFWRERILPSYKRVKSQQLVGGLGYISLGGVNDRKELDGLYESLKSSSGLIFDIREPNWIGTDPGDWFFERLADRPIASGVEEIPLYRSYDESGALGFRFFRRPSRTRPPTGAHPYTKSVVVLVGAWVHSAWESVTMMLQQIEHVTLVGAVTPGSTGNSTSVPLPGGGSFSCTGMRVMQPDGSRFQNIGVVPEVEVYPTVEGIRAGRDEVREKGIEVLRRKIEDAASVTR